jgi:ATP-binding cassette subfamily B protein/subfamily B ATP-binding cassette protein MsbA
VSWSRRLLRYGRPHRSGLALVSVLMLVAVIFDALKPWPLKLLVDYALTHKEFPSAVSWIERLPGAGSDHGLVAWLAAGTVAFFVLSATALIVQRYVMSGIGSRMTYALGADVFAHLQRLSLGFHRRNRSGDLSKRVTDDSECVRQLFGDVLLPVLSASVTLIVMFVVMVRLDPLLACVAVVVALPLALVLRRLTAPMTDKSYLQYELEGEMLALAEQTLTALPVVQAFGREDFETTRFRWLSIRAVRAHLGVTRSQIVLQLATSGLTGLGTALVIVVGGLHVVDGRLTLGSLLVFLSYLASLYAPIATLAYVTASYATAAGGGRRVMEILTHPVDVDDLPGARALDRPLEGRVSIENVSYGYEPGRPALNGVTFGADPGETVALVGRTGAGKSTLLSLIPRFFDPWSGIVSIDGHDVRDIKLEDLRRNIAIVLQEPFLLPVSVAESIAYGRPDASRDEIVAAASAAAAHDFILELPDGYDTVIGERGASLSGGERQRLSIARAVLKDAQIVILDEPTSAIDIETEAEIIEALERLVAGRTTFVIAHRLSTVRNADRVLVIDDGRIIEDGVPAKLLKKRGMYRRLHELQHGDGATLALERRRRAPRRKKVAS